MSLLSIVQDFCRRTNLNVPTAVMSNTDPQISQIRALLEEEGRDLAGRGDWERLTYEATHTTLAQENQGAITSIATNGFDHIKNGTFWDRDLRLPVYVISDVDWQQVKATAVTGPRYQVRIRGGDLISNPAPVAGHIWAFEYISENWLTNAAGDTYKKAFTADTDLILLDEDCIMMGLRWRWLREKGLEYSELFRSYELKVKDELGRSGVKRVVNMGARPYTPEPKIFVPDGSWSV